MCGQIVLCRGVNDGEELLRSLNDLAALYPAMSSVAIVPAGLTKFREKLYPLTDFTPLEAGNIIDMINSVGEEHKAKHGTRLFYAADEFYLKAGREIPSAEYYEDYSQIENGVGMLRSCQDEFGMALDDAAELLSDRDKKRTVSLVTGVAAYPMIKEQIDKLCKICPNLNVDIYEIKNYFFGESITVSGLLTGKDIYEQLKDKPLGEELLIPHNCLRHGEEVFLCGMTVSELSEKLSVPVRTSGQDGYELCEAILGRSI
jgi:putative radical SAM enzyme (TIGR03279 family)